MKQPGNFRFLAFIALIAIVGLACGGTTSTPTQAPVVIQPTPVPQQPPTATEPPVVQQPSGPSGDQFFTEEFDGDISNWSYFVTKNDSTADDSGVAPTTDNGYLVFDLHKYLNVYAIYEPQTYDNVGIDVRVENRGTNNNNINLVCRYSDEGWYEIAIANNGLYWLYAFDGAKGSYVRLADGGSNDIKAGKETNEYTFICNDRNLILGINGNEVRKYTDNQYVLRDGQIGVGLSSFNDLPVKVEYDWVQISQP